MKRESISSSKYLVKIPSFCNNFKIDEWIWRINMNSRRKSIKVGTSIN